MASTTETQFAVYFELSYSSDPDRALQFFALQQREDDHMQILARLLTVKTAPEVGASAWEKIGFADDKKLHIPPPGQDDFLNPHLDQLLADNKNISAVFSRVGGVVKSPLSAGWYYEPSNFFVLALSPDDADVIRSKKIFPQTVKDTINSRLGRLV